MKILLIMSILGFLNQPSENFTKLICEYELNELSVELSKKELCKGFKRIDKINCLKNINPTSFWFTLIRNGNSSETKIVKFKNRDTIPSLFKEVKKGDVINFTMTMNQNYLERRDKTIYVI